MQVNVPQPENVTEKTEKTEKAAAVDEGGLFQCALCQWSERYHGHGTSVPFARAVVFSEDAYVMRDPFVPYAANAYVFLGAPCSLCQKLVCAHCSVFYARRFCALCSLERLEHFPVQVQKKIQQLKAAVK